MSGQHDPPAELQHVLATLEPGLAAVALTAYQLDTPEGQALQVEAACLRGAQGLLDPPKACEVCGELSHNLSRPGPMTHYHWDGTGANPNATGEWCPACCEDYTDYWTERWDDYYAGLL